MTIEQLVDGIVSRAYNAQSWGDGFSDVITFGVRDVRKFLEYVPQFPLERITDFRIKWKNSESAGNTDAHTEHCCLEHMSCKYGYSDLDGRWSCSVVTLRKWPSYPCNCEWM